MVVTDFLKFSLKAVGSIMNAKWMQSSGVDFGGFCIAQGVFEIPVFEFQSL